jgi:hypothetical protein
MQEITNRSSRVQLSVKRALVVAAVFGGLAATSLPRIAAAQQGHPPLPEEAFTACASKAEGAACSVQFHDKEIAGTCAKGPDDSRLFCRLSERPPPPPEAFTACADKKAADSCTVTFGSHTMTGTCTEEGPDGKLACAPPHPNGGRPPGE